MAIEKNNDTRPIVNLVLMCEDEFLLCLRSGHERIDHQYHWAAPGGSGEANEDLRLAAKREFAEEVLGGKEAVDQLSSVTLEELPAMTREDGRVIHTFFAHLSKEQRDKLRIEKNWENLSIQWIPYSDLPPFERFHPDFVPALNGVLSKHLQQAQPIGERELDRVANGRIRLFHGGPNRIQEAKLGYIYSNIGYNLDGAGFYSGDIKTAGPYAGAHPDGTGGWMHTVDFAFSPDECLTDKPKKLTDEQEEELARILAMENVPYEKGRSDKGWLTTLERQFGSEKAREILYAIGIKGFISYSNGKPCLCLAYNPEDVTIRHIEMFAPPRSALNIIESYQVNRLDHIEKDWQRLDKEIAAHEEALQFNKGLMPKLGTEKIKNPGKRWHQNKYRHALKPHVLPDKDYKTAETAFTELMTTFSGLINKYEDLNRRDKNLDYLGYGRWNKKRHFDTMAYHKNLITGFSFRKLFRTKRYLNSKAQYERMEQLLKENYVPELDTKWGENIRNKISDLLKAPLPSFQDSTYTALFDLIHFKLNERATRMDGQIRSRAEPEIRDLHYNEKSLGFRSLVLKALGKDFGSILERCERKGVVDPDQLLEIRGDPKAAYDLLDIKSDDKINKRLAACHYLATRGHFNDAMNLALYENYRDYAVVISLCEAYPTQAEKHKEAISRNANQGIKNRTQRDAIDRYIIPEVIVEEQLGSSVGRTSSIFPDLFFLSKETRQKMVLDSKIIHEAVQLRCDLWQSLIMDKIDKRLVVDCTIAMMNALADISASVDLAQNYHKIADALRQDALKPDFLEGYPPHEVHTAWTKGLSAMAKMDKSVRRSILIDDQIRKEQKESLESARNAVRTQWLELRDFRRQHGRHSVHDLLLEEFTHSYKEGYRALLGQTYNHKAFFPTDMVDQITQAWIQVHPNADPILTHKAVTDMTEYKCAIPNKAPFPDSLSQLTELHALQGSTRPLLMRNEKTGALFVVKRGGSPGQAEIEYKANRIYDALGLAVPEARLYHDENGNPMIALRYIQGRDQYVYENRSTGFEKHALYQDIGKGFVADTVLENWDVVANAQNVRVGEFDNWSYRIDVGGSLTSRAQGGDKAWQADDISTIDTLRGEAYSNSQKVYGRVSYPELAEQIISFREHLPNVQKLVSEGVITRHEYATIENKFLKIEQRFAPVVETYKHALKSGGSPIWFTHIDFEPREPRIACAHQLMLEDDSTKKMPDIPTPYRGKSERGKSGGRSRFHSPGRT